MSPDLYPVARRLLFTLEPERAHAAALSLLRCATSLGALRNTASGDGGVSLLGLRFPNCVGLAAGFDKNGRYIDALGALGFGFIEVGTVTPRPQPGQSKPRLFRIESAEALINRMGFPNDGAEAAAARLSKRKYAGVCGVNIGKNAATALDDAVADYVTCFRTVAPVADYVAINVSSPNTKDLVRLQQASYLESILDALLRERERLHIGRRGAPPLLLKVSPDLSCDRLEEAARVMNNAGVDGVIATNTTVTRPGVAGRPHAQEEGGLSGAPLRPLAVRTIEALRSRLPASTPIIAVGGIDSVEAARQALRAGAAAVQIYTGLIYRGPRLVAEILGSG